MARPQVAAASAAKALRPYRGSLRVNRNMTLDEWHSMVGGGEYRRHCSQVPGGEGAPINAPSVDYPVAGG